MNISNILTGLCSIFFFMIGADKFLAFLEPACSLVDSIHLATEVQEIYRWILYCLYASIYHCTLDSRYLWCRRCNIYGHHVGLIDLESTIYTGEEV